MFKKKSLGQHFLKSKGALLAIRDALNPTATDLVVEIGPGEGALTEELLPFIGKLVALEKDQRLIPILQEKFAAEVATGKLEVIEGDALEFDPSTLRHYTLSRFDYMVVGNIPYYITGALFKKFLTAETQPSRLVFLVQKEVAERIAREPKESLLSLSVKAYGTPKYIKTVPAGSFVPPPEVDSAILLIDEISRKNFENRAHEEKFFELLRAGFAHKRKLLKRNIEEVVGTRAETMLESVGVPQNARAEDVLLEKWLQLAKLS
jgi:16S rRNA (adenine1518-N6/adenine1519-N6)-dimethyltransferase